MVLIGVITTQNLYLPIPVRLEGKGVGVQLGNLNASDLEVNLVGRGAEVSVNPFKDKRSAFGLGLLKKL